MNNEIYIKLPEECPNCGYHIFLDKETHTRVCLNELCNHLYLSPVTDRYYNFVTQNYNVSSKCEICNEIKLVYKVYDDKDSTYKKACSDCILLEQISINEKVFYLTKKDTNTIEELIQHELYKANKKFPQFSSSHEGKAIIEEEIDEANDEMKLLEYYFEKLWKDIKKNKPLEDLLIYIYKIEEKTLLAINELIQVGAMCKKFRMLENKENEKT